MLLHDERMIASQNKVVMIELTFEDAAIHANYTLSNFTRSLPCVGINLGVVSGSQCQEIAFASNSYDPHLNHRAKAYSFLMHFQKVLW